MSRRKRRTSSVATIVDIARLAQVSKMTVSRVMSGTGSASPATRALVMEKARILGYVPNLSARQLVRGATPSIGVLYGPEMAHELGPVLIATQRAAQRLGVRIVPCEVELIAGAARLRSLCNSLRAAIVVSPLSSRSEALLQQVEIPLVRIAVETAACSPCVRIDEFAAACAITNELVSQGHHVLAFIDAAAAGRADDARRRGFEAAIAGHAQVQGVVADSVARSFHAGMQACGRLLDAHPRITAFVCSHDLLAAAAMLAAQRRGIDVPAQLSVAGFGDHAIALRCSPELTTVRIPLAAMAARALDMAVNPAAAAGESILPFEIVRRGSTGPRRPQIVKRRAAEAVVEETV